MDILPQAFLALANYKQFIISRQTPTEDGIIKQPVDLSGQHLIDPHLPTNQHDFVTVRDAVARLGSRYQIGFVFTDNDPFFFIDLDDCILADGTYTTLAQDVLKRFQKAAVEISTSGQGLHIFGKYSMAMPDHACNKTISEGVRLEFYHTKRFVALTGTNAYGDVNSDHTGAAWAFIRDYMSPTNVRSAPNVTSDIVRVSPPLTDEEIIQKALNQKINPWRDGEKEITFKDLWECNVDKLAAKWAPNKYSDAFNASHAEASLATRLAFYTQDLEQIDRLIRQSGLYRPKWDREDYAYGTISKAIKEVSAHYCGSKKAAAMDGESATEGQVTTSPLSSQVSGGLYDAEEQAHLFSGCVYVEEDYKAYVPDGSLLNEKQFNKRFGQRQFVIDKVHAKLTRKAWEAFTDSHVFTSAAVHKTADTPLRKTGEIFFADDRMHINLWRHLPGIRTPGDVTPFLNLLSKMLPNEEDRKYLLAYFAACVQRPGVKYDWMIVIQGVQGNGKSLLTQCLVEAIGRTHTHSASVTKFTERFNDWLDRKLLIYLDDFFRPGDVRLAIETLKPLLTGARHEIEGKGIKKVEKEIFCNFLINTNQKDAIPVTKDDRRLAVFYTAQQSVEDKLRDGLTDEFFIPYHHWLVTGGFEHVAHYLATYPLGNPDILQCPQREYDPLYKRTAPTTSCKAEVITESLGLQEQLIQEAIDSCLDGFRNGWAMSFRITSILSENRGRRVGPNTIKPLMLRLGYIPHPGLNKGRTNRNIEGCSGHPVLYLKQDHPALALIDAEIITKTYEMSQK
jgi:hypothetical protein